MYLLRVFAPIALIASTLLGSSFLPGQESLVANRLEQHTRFLAKDEHRGRMTGSPGLASSAKHIETGVRDSGLLPLGTGGYRQAVQFERNSVKTDSARCTYLRDGNERSLVYDRDYVFDCGAFERLAASDAPLAFVGYGVSGQRYDSYAGIDVKDKIVVVLETSPKEINEAEEAYVWEKYEAALTAGACGVLFVALPKDGWPWQAVSDFYAPGAWRLKGSKNEEEGFWPYKIPVSYISVPTARMLFRDAEASFADVLRWDTEDIKSMKSFPLKGQLSLSGECEKETIDCFNLVCKIEGSDPTLRDEYLVYSAHLDHLGTGTRVDGDAIFNGAFDNAAGAAILLELAQRFANAKVKPKRSIIFLWVTGEEMGMLGSKWFVENPPVALEKIVANVNIDMPLFIHDFKDIAAYSAPQSSLLERIAKVTSLLNLEFNQNPFPDENFEERSDHYNFLLAGIPAAYVDIGAKSKSPENPNAMTKIKAWMITRYHGRSDDIEQPDMNWQAAARFTHFCYVLGSNICNERDRPQFTDHSRFNPKNRDANDGVDSSR